MISSSKPGPAYPSTRKSAQADDLHGVRIADPYRWLEDLDSPETAAWVEAQNRVNLFLPGIHPGPIPPQGAAHGPVELRALRDAVPQGRAVFLFSRTTACRNQSVLYTMARLDEAPRVLIDPNGFFRRRQPWP